MTVDSNRLFKKISAFMLSAILHSFGFYISAGKSGNKTKKGLGLELTTLLRVVGSL